VPGSPSGDNAGHRSADVGMEGEAAMELVEGIIAEALASLDSRLPQSAD